MRIVSIAAIMLAATACSQPAATPAGADKTTPVYNKQTGRLERLESDRNGDGKVDTWAYMDGTRLLRIEVDSTGDGRPNRFEHYAAPPAGSTEQHGGIERLEQADGPTDRITRRAFYATGQLQRVEEDTDFDGRMDKWEHYDRGELVRLDLDLKGRGVADQRLFYQGGAVVRVESDPDGDGVFAPGFPGGKSGG
jgi:hypothetical protein